jgi:sugar lactone lactonase YvrE
MKKVLLFTAAITCLANANAQENVNEPEKVYEVENNDYADPAPTTYPKQNTSAGKNFKIVKKFASPITSTYIDDVEFDGKYLWVNGYEEGKIYQVSTETGEVIRDIPTDITNTMGMAFDGKYLWLVDQGNNKIEKIDPQSGEVVGSIPTPAAHDATYATGLCWDGKHFWHNDPKGSNIETNEHDSTWMLNPDGTIYKGFAAHGGYPTGLTFDGKYLWSCDNEFDVVHKINPETFEIIETYNAPGGDYPNGLAFDGKYLWITNNETDSIYQVEIPTNDPVTNYTWPGNDTLITAQSINIAGLPDSLFFAWSDAANIIDVEDDIDSTEIPIGLICRFIPPVINDDAVTTQATYAPLDSSSIFVITLNNDNDVNMDNDGSEPLNIIRTDQNNTTPDPVAIIDVTNIVAYPNPTAGQVKFELLTGDFSSNTKVIIYDIAGNQVMEKTFQSNYLNVDLTPYDSGVFMYTIISNGNSIKSGRIVKEGARN